MKNKQVFNLADGKRLMIVTKPELWLKRGDVYSQSVFLGVEDNPENWEVITQAEYEKETRIDAEQNIL